MRERASMFESKLKLKEENVVKVHEKKKIENNQKANFDGLKRADRRENV